MGVCPKGLGDGSLNRRQRPARVPAISVHLLKEILGTRDTGLRNGVICACDDALQLLRFLKDGKIRLCLLRNVEQLGNGIL